MNVTLTWIETNFAKLNRLYFNNELPTPKFRVNHARRFWGMFYSYRASARLRLTAPENGAYHGLPYGELCISDYDQRPELDKLNTLLHEMVHLWQYWNNLPDQGHGRDFKRKAEELNQYGWQIQRVAGVPTERAWAHYNEGVEVPEEPAKVSVSASNSRKVAALRRSISILEAKLVLTPENQKKLNQRKAELLKLLSA